ncbi:hypothetical protein SODALDRAFT_326702 [Sodiomyces alkalinus F11]|uniref:Uncharacterized protein n=1 Tax=Sodiomyces alkalinus (strain CBS 110278 / VKM F-3762 / F11) TaxID=1314773 RepID=A0A3N2Q722_SODAK|nr:hypothetical protein SODALDRAFT_326702 [Sodiomyces alkalinus F11]ROT42542.1 hypothetical protein SODALDRAFT_326702 [Sodiomyces alkalinus F11]
MPAFGNTTVINNTSAALSNGVSDIEPGSAIVGWVRASDDRGTVDILFSCCLTIVLCVWVSTYPNVPSPQDRWYHQVRDKFNLACIGFLGPDFLFGIAIGQLTSARRSVKMFRDSPELLEGRLWTLTHAFYADMGGFILTSPDYPLGFPIDAEQLYYLVKHGHLDFPRLTLDRIKEKSKADTLSRILVLWQVIWFSATEFHRIANGHPITTLELTALTFACVMVATSAVWYFKPSIANAEILETREGRTVAFIRDCARHKTHPNLPIKWYRTPLDFISRRNFHIDKHWQYYSRLTHIVGVPFFSREVRTVPWDRFPSDTWIAPEGWIIPFGLLIQIPFSLAFLAGWDMHFPSEGEMWAWRACSIFHAAYSLLGTVYFMFGSLRGRGERLISLRTVGGLVKSQSDVNSGATQNHTELSSSSDLESQLVQDDVTLNGLGALRAKTGAVKPLRRAKTGFTTWVARWRNISLDQDPDMEVPLRWMVPFLIPTFLYIFCRLYFYAEDFIALRQQPEAVYLGHERFIPFF